MVSPMSASDHLHTSPNLLHSSRNTQLPSPISPTIQPTPIMSPVSSYSAHHVPCPQPQRCDIAPIKGFVHEVLRRSRTSGTVLQTALCYLEAIRLKIPDLVQKEKLCFSSSSPAGLDDERISQDEGSIDYDTGLGGPALAPDVPPSSGLLATIRINPISYEADASFSIEPGLDADKVLAHKSKIRNTSLPPLPALPSPLLCPRRTFLASLILASKFMQDRCYSNRAWAKLSGLPPREIGRCERALGEALEWRLWVGKLPAVQSASGRALTKSKSETNINFSGNYTASNTDVSPPGSKVSPLRRCATVPAGSLDLEGPRIIGNDNASPIAYSASPSTPGLSFSPTPTESSLGDRTVQMATFMDVSTPPPGQFATFIGVQNDKVLPTSVPSNGLYVYTGSQDIVLPSLSQRIDSQYFVSHGAVPQNSVWMFNDDA